MTGGFSKVYEQWLKNSNSNDKEDSDEDANMEMSYEDPEGIADLMDSDTTEDEDGGSPIIQTPFFKPQWREKSTGLVSDSAPILVDDDDEIFPSEKQQFEEEPPVLEPVSKPSTNLKSSGSQHSCLDTQLSVRNYSRENLIRSRSSEKKTMKTYSSSKGKVVGDPQDLNDCLIKSKETGNIFDKFTPFPERVEDDPPPLIPSPEALRLHSESPSGADQSASISDRKHPGCSPDFCAMEADSTSEISGGSASNCVRNKNSSLTDMAVECDSTCMLGGSPAIVSPASVSNGDSEVRDQGGGVDGDAGSPAELARGTAYAGDLIRSDPVVSLETEDICCGQDQPQVSRHMRVSTLPLLPGCPGINVSANTTSSCPTVSVLSPAQTACESHRPLVSGDTPTQDEPPILCANPAPITSQSRSSMKRHTIDSPYTFSSSGKRPRTFPSPKGENSELDIDCSAPPLLPLMSETVINLTSPPDKQAKSVSRKSSKRASLSSRQAREQRHRRNTVPTVDLSSDVSHLPEELQQFVLSTRQLSALQSSVHSLALTLLPQLKGEVSSMSPESLKFEHFLRDMVQSLQLGDDLSGESQPPLTLTIKCEKDAGGHFTSKDKFADPTAARLSDPPRVYSSNFSPHPTGSNYPQTDELSGYSLASACSKRQTRQCTLREDPIASEVIPQFSQLDLRTGEGDESRKLRPLRVCVQRTSHGHLHKFCVLCCDLLQLLLPELPVSLCNELSDSPLDLLTFVDNVVASNQRERRKHLL